MDPYESLANAVIIQAAKDYRAGRRELKKLLSHEPVKKSGEDESVRWKKWNTRKTDVENNLSDLKRFFYSQWFTMLSSTDGPALYERLKEEADSDEC